MIELVSMGEQDLELVLAWRNNPIVYQGLYTQSQGNRGLTWTEHVHWWAVSYGWARYMIIYDELVPRSKDSGRKVGYLNIRFDKASPEIGLSVGETGLWGQGIGKAALQEAMALLRKRGFTKTETTILWDNTRSQRLFESCGFVKGAVSRPGESYYEASL